MLTSVVLALTFASCSFVVRVHARIESVARLQWSADTVALAFAHAGPPGAAAIARATGVDIVHAAACDADICVTVADADGTASSRASRG